ncbi:MAG: subclass B3 metallo-beta-lactamase, partial [Sphingomonadales bacterium 32-67-7]
MKIAIATAALALTAACALPAEAQSPPAALPKAPVSAFLTQCKGKDGWNDPAPPFHIYGNTYGVGTCGMNALLVVSPEGLALVDVGTQEAAALVAENIRSLGFELSDVKWIVASHEHWDHVGGIAEMQRLTGAKVGVLASARDSFEQGHHNPIDPQGDHTFPKIRVDRVLEGGDSVKVGQAVLTIHATPTHSPGSSSWTWQACEDSACKTIAYADSATTISSDDYRFSDHP